MSNLIDKVCWRDAVDNFGQLRCPHNDDCQQNHWALTFDIDGHTCDNFLRWLEKEAKMREGTT